MNLALVTRGLEQQLDYNVIKSERPFGEIMHGQMDALGRYKTTANDFYFSFVVRCDGSKWEVLINCIQTVRRDFAGSALRTYLYLTGDKSQTDDWQLARNALMSEVAAWWPQQQLPTSTPLGRALDSVLTNDIVKGLVGWKSTAKIDAQQWVESQLKPAIKNSFTGKTELGNASLDEFASELNAVSRSGGIVTGEFLPYLIDAEGDEPNLTFHFSSGRTVRVRGNGRVESGNARQPQHPPPHPPPPPSPQPLPPPPIPHCPWKAVVSAVTVLAVLGLVINSCQKSRRVTSTSVTAFSPENVATNIAPAVTNAFK